MSESADGKQVFLSQIITTVECEVATTVQFDNRRDLDHYYLKGGWSSDIKNIIKWSVNQLLADHPLTAEMVSRQQMEELQRIGVSLGNRPLVCRFTLIRNGTDAHYARYSLHYLSL